jgi:hypothetical protein
MVDIKHTSSTTMSPSNASSRAPTAVDQSRTAAPSVAEKAAAEDVIQAAQDALLKQNKMLHLLHQRMAPSAYYSAQNMLGPQQK